MKVKLETNEATRIFYREMAEIWKDAKYPYFILNRNFQVVWRNKTAQRQLNSFKAFSDFLPHCPDFTLPKIKAHLADFHSLEIPLSPSLPGGFQILGIMNAPPKCKGSLLLCFTHKAKAVTVAKIKKDLDSTVLNHFVDNMDRLLNPSNYPSDWLQNPKKQEATAMMRTSTMEIRRMLEMQEEFFKLQEGQISHQPEQVDLPAFLTLVLKYAHSLLEKTGVELRYHLPEESLMAYAEPKYILRALAQLISNAVRFRKENTPIGVAYATHENFIEISVENTGSIPEKAREKLFEPKFSYIPNGTGHGLGLSIAMEYAKFMGGSLNVEEKDCNTVFKMLLPLHHSAPAESYDYQLRVLLSDIPLAYKFLI